MQISIHRIWLLVRKQWAENQQLYILGMLAMAGIIAGLIIYNISSFEGFDKRSQKNLFFLSMVVVGSIFATTILSQFNTKHAGIQALMLPASALEKFVVAAIYSIIVFPVCFVVIVYPLIIIGHYVDRELIGSNNLLYVANGDLEEFIFIFIFLILQSVALFCSVLFKRYVFIKSAILVIIVFFGVIISNPLIARRIVTINTEKPVIANISETYYDVNHNIVAHKEVKESTWTRIRSAMPYSEMEINNWFVKKKHNGVNYISYNTEVRNKYHAFFYALLVISIPFLWLITWFRLKEKEL
ncbi:hypothetical protein [Mucilaginibacter ginsenosidivorax]|uniref:Uncharacterized protein n=1 Tax=Mucilaginibacter ginsenosidivorax TaxID=862126 RepID=A0A5B8W8R1_9SPHI|nr:hypothetical protein [Mucilaginibacter ginsenosidivorax]QEC79847.1 hypothetical protein FSB76_29250 [Mucilaginibacter ginsenosidivorax]